MPDSYAWLALLSICIGLAWLLGCAAVSPSSPGGISRQGFGSRDDTPVYLFTLLNSRGAEAKISNYGGIVVSLKVPDREGRLGDVVLGFDNLDDYVSTALFSDAWSGVTAIALPKGNLP